MLLLKQHATRSCSKIVRETHQQYSIHISLLDGVTLGMPVRRREITRNYYSAGFILPNTQLMMDSSLAAELEQDFCLCNYSILNRSNLRP